MPFVTLPDGVRMYYETEGAGEPLLLIMSLLILLAGTFGLVVCQPEVDG